MVGKEKHERERRKARKKIKKNIGIIKSKTEICCRGRPGLRTRTGVCERRMGKATKKEERKRGK